MNAYEAALFVVFIVINVVVRILKFVCIVALIAFMCYWLFMSLRTGTIYDIRLLAYAGIAITAVWTVSYAFIEIFADKTYWKTVAMLRGEN